VVCLSTSAEAIEEATPLYALRLVFTRLFALAGQVAGDDAAALVARLPEPVRPLAPLLSPVLPIDLPDTPRTAQLRGVARTQLMLRLLVQTFRGLTAGAPTLLVVEDVHWLDSLSWALLEQLHAHVDGLLLVLTSRLQPSPPNPYLRIKQAAGPLHLRLDPLSADQATQLACQRLGVASLPAPVAGLLRDKAEGNPFFAVELALALRDAGVIRVEGGVCEAVELPAAMAFPDTIEGVVTSRLDRLQPLEQLALKVASVLGRTFDAANLRDLFPVADARPQVPAVLRELARLELTQREQPEQSSYLFRHAITQEVAYNLMLFEQRRALHEAAAEWYERVHGGDLAPFRALLAHHRLHALDGLAEPDEPRVERALDALVLAGRQALASGAAIEAAAQLERAAELLSRLPESQRRDALELDLRTLEGAALAVVRGPAHERVRQVFARARELCERLGETSRLFEAVFGIWYTNVTTGERAGAIEFSSRLVEIAAAAGDPAVLAVAHHARGATAICDGRNAEGLEDMDRVLGALARSGGAAGALAQARNTEVMSHCYRAWANFFLGFPDAAIADTRHAIEVARRVGHPLTMVQALCFAALVHRYRCEPALAEEQVADAARLTAEHSIPYWGAIVSAIYGWLEIERGELEAAVRRLLEGRAREREAGLFSLTAVIVLSDLIDAHTRLGRFDEAAAVVAEAHALRERKLIGYAFPDILRLEGELHRRRGEPALAAARFDEAIALARRSGMRPLELRALVSASRLRVDQGRPPDPSLAEAYHWFTEGHALRDLAAARALLDGAGER
jgi:tetratricopeptide (TPR) repeat protein